MLWETACPLFDDGQLSFEYCEFVVVTAYPPDSLVPTDKILATGLGVGNFTTKLVAMATSLEESDKVDLIKKIHTNTFHLVKRP